MPAPHRPVGHSKIINLLDKLVESLFVAPTGTKTCGYGQSCEADNDPDEILSMSLEQFQLLALGVSFVVAMGWICCIACLSSIIQQPSRTTLEKSAPIYNTSSLPTDMTAKIPSSSSVSARIKGSLFLLLYKIRRCGTGPRSENTTRTPANSVKSHSSSRATVTASERSLRSDSRCPQSRSRVHTRGSVTEHGQSEVSFMESSARSHRHRREKGGLETRSGSYSDMKDAGVSPHSDWKDGIHLSVEPHSDWNDDDIGTCVEPHSHWKGDARECIELHSHWKEGIEACTEPPSVWSDDVDAHTELHSDWKDGRKSRAKAPYNWKKDTVSRTELHSNWKKSRESISESRYNRRHGTGYGGQPIRGMKKGRDSWFQHYEHEHSEKITDNTPTSGFARSRRNTDTNPAYDDSRKKQSSKADVKGYFPGKRESIIPERLVTDYCNVNSDEAVSDLLHGDLGWILSKYYKDKCTDTPDFDTRDISIHTKKMTVPSSNNMKGDGLPVQSAVEFKERSLDVTPNSTPECRRRLSMTYTCPSYQNKKIRKGKDSMQRDVKPRSKRSKRSRKSNISVVSSKSSLLALHREENDSGNPVIQVSQNIITETHAFKNANQKNRQSADHLWRMKHHNNGLESVNYDQQSIVSSQSRYSTASQRGIGSQRERQASSNSDSVQGHPSVIFPNFSTEAVINSLPHSEVLSSWGEHANRYGDGGAASSSREILAETSKPSKKLKEKRKDQYGRTSRSGKSIRRSEMWKTATMSSGENGSVGKALNGEEVHASSLAPNPVLSSTEIKCLVTSKIQRLPHTSTAKEPLKRGAGNNRKDISMKSIAVQKDICSTCDKHSTAQQTSIQFQPFRHQIRKTDQIFQGGNSLCPPVSDFGFAKHVDEREPITCLRKVLANDPVVTYSSNYDTDRQSVLSQTDATSWSMNIQLKNSERDQSEDAHIQSRKNKMERGSFQDSHVKDSKITRKRGVLENSHVKKTHSTIERGLFEDAHVKSSKHMIKSDNNLKQEMQPKFVSQDWEKLVLANGTKKLGYQNIATQIGYTNVANQLGYQNVASQPDYQNVPNKKPRQNELSSVGYLGGAKDSKVAKNSQNQNIVPTERKFDRNSCVNEKDTLRNCAQTEANAQKKTHQDKISTGELVPNRSNTSITKEEQKRRSLIPRHIKTPPKINLIQQETPEKARRPANAMRSGINTTPSRASGQPRDRSVLTSAIKERRNFGEMTNSKRKDRLFVSERQQSAKLNRFEVNTGKRQAHLGSPQRGKQSGPQTRAKTVTTPAVPKAITGGSSRWVRSVAKHTKDQHRPAAKRLEKKDLSSPMKHPGFIIGRPKLYTPPSEHKKRTNVKPNATKSKAQGKQTRPSDELKSTLITNNEKGEFTDANKDNVNEKHMERDIYSKEHHESDNEIGTDVDDADHAQADGSNSHSASDEFSLLTLTTLNYRLMSSSPINQEEDEAEVQKGSSCETAKGEQENQLSCGTLEKCNPEQIILCPQIKVAARNAVKSVSGQTLISERAALSKATLRKRFQTKSFTATSKPALDNANMSRIEQSFDLPAGSSRCAKSGRSTQNIKPVNRPIPSNAASTHYLQSTHDLKSFKFPLGSKGQRYHVKISTDLNSVGNENTDQWTKNVISGTDIVYSANTKTNNLNVLRSTSRENGDDHWQASRSDFNVGKTFRKSSRRLCSELDCNKSNTVDVVTDESCWTMERIGEVGDCGTCCRGGLKQRPTDTTKRFDVVIPQCKQRQRVGSALITSKLMENELSDSPFGLCTERENKEAIRERNARFNPMLHRTELQNVEKLRTVHSRSNVVLNSDKTTNREYTFTYCHLLNLPSSTSQLNNSGFSQPRVNETQETKESSHRVRGIAATANQKTRNTCSKFKGSQNRDCFKHNEAHPMVESPTGRQFKLSTQFYRNGRKLPINRINHRYTKLKTLHKNSASTLTEQQSHRMHTQDRCNRLHNIFKKLHRKQLVCNQTGISEGRIKYVVTKAAKKGQLKTGIKPQNVTFKRKLGKTFPSEKHCKPVYKTSVEDRTLVGSNVTLGVSKQNEAVRAGNSASCQTTSRWLEVGRPVGCQTQLNMSSSGLQNAMGHSESHRVQVEKNRKKCSESTIHRLASLSSRSPGNDFGNQIGVENLGSARQAADIPIINNVSQWDSASLKNKPNNITELNTEATYRGDASGNVDIQSHEKPLKLSDNITYKNKLLKCQKLGPYCGSLRSSTSTSSAGVEAKTCLSSPGTSSCSMLKGKHPEEQGHYFTEGEFDDITLCRTTLAPSVQSGNSDSDVFRNVHSQYEAYNGNTAEQTFMNKQTQLEFLSDTDNSELSEDSVYKAREILSSDTLNYLPSSNELFLLPDIISNAPKDVASGTLAYSQRFNENVTDDTNVMFRKKQPYYRPEDNEQCCPKTRCLDDKCYEPGFIPCPRGCNFGPLFRRDVDQEEQKTSLQQFSQTRANTGLQDKDEGFMVFEGNQVTNSKSKTPFFFNITSDCTSTDNSKEDFHDVLPTVKGKSSILVPINSVSFNHYQKENKSTNQYYLSQDSSLKFSSSHKSNSMIRFPKKKERNPDYRLMKDNKTNAKYQVLSNNEPEPHQQAPCLISSPSLTMRRSQSSPDARKSGVKSNDNRKRKYPDQSRPPEEPSIRLSMVHVDR